MSGQSVKLNDFERVTSVNWRGGRLGFAGLILSSFLIFPALNSFGEGNAGRCQLILTSGGEPRAWTDSYVQYLRTIPDSNLASSFTGDDIDATQTLGLTSAMAMFRNEYLGLLKNETLRESIVRSFEAQLRLRSQVLAQRFTEGSGVTDEYDVLIVGAGIHGVIAANQFLALNPNLKILIVDESDTSASNFRSVKAFITLNSSTRPTGESFVPLPGLGNLNELPGLPIQVSDLSILRYANSNDLGSAMVSNLMALLQAHPNVDLLFDTKALSIGNLSASGKETTQLQIRGSSQLIEVPSVSTLIVSGIGTPFIPGDLRKSIEADPGLVEFDAEIGLPRVISSEDLARILAESNNPRAFAKGLKIGIAGTGDSANVVIEFLMGIANPAAYGFSSGQTGQPKEIVWFNQQCETCEAYIAQARNRYSAIGAGFRSSDAEKAPLIRAVPGKLSVVRQRKRVRQKILASVNGGRDEALDLLVVVTGYEPQLRRLFELTTGGVSLKYGADKKFFDRRTNTLSGEISTSKGRRTKIGRQFPDREVYIAGPAAGPIIRRSELVGPIQNQVSIFNQGPRVQAVVMRIYDSIRERLVNPTEIKNEKVIALEASPVKAFEVQDIGETRAISSGTLPLVRGMFQDALGMIEARDLVDQTIEVQMERGPEESLQVGSSQKVNLEPLVHLLAGTRDFFGLVKLLLDAGDKQGLRFMFSISDGEISLAQVSMEVSSEIPKGEKDELIEVKNKPILLRGFAPKRKLPPKGLESSKDKKTSENNSSRSRNNRRGGSRTQAVAAAEGVQSSVVPQPRGIFDRVLGAISR